jgi:hypothetical protein
MMVIGIISSRIVSCVESNGGQYYQDGDRQTDQEWPGARTALAAAIDRPFRFSPRPDVGFFYSAESTVAQAQESRVVPVVTIKVEGLIQVGESSSLSR